VLAIELEDSVGGGGGGGGGYSSTAARPLGNVLYLMCAPTTDPARCYYLIREVWTELSIVAAGDDDDW
jgi:dethiobiotin synthetase/adenosylmethionine--8-amino-7-oxononanoate aminotransferase